MLLVGALWAGISCPSRVKGRIGILTTQATSEMTTGALTPADIVGMLESS